MSGVATAIVGGAVVGGLIQGNAAQNAANTQADAANQATAAQQGMFNIQQANEKPYLDAGTSALGQIQQNMSTYNQPFTMSQFQEDPGYQFDLEQGQKAIQSSAAASGHLVSSQQLGNASNYADSMASNEFNNAFNRYQSTNQANYNRLASVAQLGQTGVAQTNQAAQNAGNNISNNIMGAGNAAAAGQIGTANAITSGIGTATNGLMMNNFMSNLMPGQNPNQGTTINSLNGMNSGMPSATGYNGYTVSPQAVMGTEGSTMGGLVNSIA